MTDDGIWEVEVPVLTRHLCDFIIRFSHHELEATPLGTRLHVVVEDGAVIGPHINGCFLPGGGDWITLGTDGIARLDVRATFETGEGARVMVTNTGRALLDREAMDRFLSGQIVRAHEVYARSSPLFETGHESYRWLNGVHTVAVNQFSLHEVHYRVHQVL